MKVRGRDHFWYLLESAGEGGLRVSGEQHSLGDGDLSRLVTGSKWRPAGPWCPAASVLLILCSWLPCMTPCPPPATPSTGMPFSERNSSRSTYYRQRSETLFPRGISWIWSRVYLTQVRTDLEFSTINNESDDEFYINFKNWEFCLSSRIILYLEYR